MVQAWDLVIPKPALPAFVFRNWETKLKIFDTFDRGFIWLTNYSHWDNWLRWFMGAMNSQMFFQTKTSPRLEIIARWGPSPSQCGPPVWMNSQIEDAESGADFMLLRLDSFSKTWMKNSNPWHEMLSESLEHVLRVAGDRKYVTLRLQCHLRCPDKSQC